ncbi:MAG: cupredoxin domain-containing protein [Dehalococcoidia bacterium]
MDRVTATAITAAVAGILLLAAVVFVLLNPAAPAAPPAPVSPRVAEETPATGVKSFTFQVQDETSPWTFVSLEVDNPTIEVNTGDTVEITFISDGQIPHTWTLDADSPSPYDVTTAILESGRSETLRFIADKPGTYTYYCKVPGHRDLGMVGTIIVQ